MTWGNVGAAAIGVVGGALGSSSASGASKSAARKQAQTEEARLEFEQQKYDEWKDTYGPIEDNLAEYYNELTPGLRTMQGLEAFNKERDQALTGLRENLAQRGIQLSGIAAQTETNVAIESASERARIRAAAPMEVAKEKLSFLKTGLGQDPSSGVSNALADRSTRAANEYRATAQASGQATQSFVEAGTNLASELFTAFQNRDKGE